MMEDFVARLREFMEQNVLPYKSRVTYITRSFPTRMEQGTQGRVPVSQKT